MMSFEQLRGWTNRLGSTTRYVLIVGAALLVVAMLGMIFGYSAAMLEDGTWPTKPLAYIGFAAILGVTALVGWVLVSLVRSLNVQTMSGFDRRYWKMWAILVALSLPIGVVLGRLAVNHNNPGILPTIVSDTAISQMVAIGTSIGLVMLFAIAAVYYHRIIDDHEERAHLWASTFAHYFLLLAFPVQWLLSRGGLVPPVTSGSALLLIMLSCVVHAIVWAMFKFR